MEVPNGDGSRSLCIGPKSFRDEVRNAQNEAFYAQDAIRERGLCNYNRLLLQWCRSPTLDADHSIVKPPDAMNKARMVAPSVSAALVTECDASGRRDISCHLSFRKQVLLSFL